MKNFIKSFVILILISGSFLTHAMDKKIDNAPWEEKLAKARNMTLEEYREIRPFLEPHERTEWKKQEEAARLEWNRHNEALNLAWIYENAPDQILPPSVAIHHPPQQDSGLRRNQEEEQRRHQEVQPRRHIVEVTSLISRVNSLSKGFASGLQRPVLENYMRIFKELHQVAQDDNVHVLDGYVQTNICPLLEVGRLFSLDNPNFTLAQVGTQMIEFMGSVPRFFETYQYNNKPVTTARIIQVLQLHFANLDNNVSKDVQELWSRAWTLALTLYTQTKDIQHIQIIFDEAIEGHETEFAGQRGGCIPGRINRGFIAYVSLLGKAGVGIHE